MAANISKAPPRLILILGSVLLVLLVLHLAGVALLRYFVERELHPALPQGTYIGEVHVNLFSGTLRIEDFELRNDGVRRIAVGELRVRVVPWRLLLGKVDVTHVALSRGYLLVQRQEDGSFDLGLPPFGTEAGASEPAPAAEPPNLIVRGVSLENLALVLNDGELSSTLYIDSAKAGAYSARADEQKIPLEWQLHWDGRAITGAAELALAGDTLAAAGSLATELLDLGRAQELARQPPQAVGTLSFDGRFDWRPARLTLDGDLKVPALKVAAAAQQVALRDLEVPGFALDLTLSPAISADLSLSTPLRLQTLDWQAAGQGAALAALSLTGDFRYTPSDASADKLLLNAQRIAWQDAQRHAEIQDVDVNASLRQTLDGEDALPVMQAQVGARRVQFRDEAQALTAELADVRIDQLALAAAADAAVRQLNSDLTLGAGHVVQADTTIDWSAVAAKFDGALAATPSLTGNAQISGLAVRSPQLPNGPLSVAEVTADGLRVDTDTRFSRLRIAGIALPAEIEATALKVAALELSDGRYAADGGVALGEIVVDGVQTAVVRDKAGVWRHVMSTSASAPTAPTAPPAPAAGQGAANHEAAPAWRIGGLRVTGDSHITVADTLNPDMNPLTYEVEKVVVGALSSTEPGNDTPFDIALRPDKFSEFTISGVVRPLAERLYLKAEGHLHGFGLTSVNGLVANDLGHRFLDGQFDDDFTITIDHDKLEMGNALALAGLDVEAIPDKDGPPLSTAIALLEDRDGNIKLEVPIAGDLTDPQFRVLGALNPIIMKAVAGTAALALQPLGSVLLVGSLLADQALKITFEPARFEPGSTELDAAARKYLGQLASKLGEKPKLRVRLCGVVADAERPRDKKGEYTDKEADALAMAHQRADAVRRYMAEQGATKAQLRTCRPAIDKSEAAKPRVDIRF